MGHTADAQTWSVVSPDLSPTDTIRPTQSPSHAAQQLDHIYTCPSCDHRSTVVYSDVRRCLNESCERWTIGAAIFRESPSLSHSSVVLFVAADLTLQKKRQSTGGESLCLMQPRT